MPGTSKKTELVTMRIDVQAMAVARGRVAKSKKPLRGYLAGILETQLGRVSHHKVKGEAGKRQR